MTRLLALLLLLPALALAQTATETAVRLLPYDLPAGVSKAAYLTKEGDPREVELTPNNPSLRIRVPAAAETMLYEPPSAELRERLRARNAAEGRPNAPLRFTPDVLTPLARVAFPSPGGRQLAVLFPTGRDNPKLLGYGMSDDPARFGAGWRRLFNLTARTIVARLGRQQVTLRPQSGMDVGAIAAGDKLAFVPVEIGYLADGAVRPLTATRWAHDPVQRTVVFIYEDPAERRVRIQACAERTDIPEPGDAPAGGAVGLGGKPAAGSAAAGRPAAAAPVAAAKPERPRGPTEAELAERKARESVDSTNFILPTP